jgi:hypothetical protein
MDTQTDSKMDPRTESRIRLLLRILRNPFVSLLVLYNLVFCAHWSGNAYMKLFASGPGAPPLIVLGPTMPLVIGAFIIGNMLLVCWSYAHFIERRPVSELSLPGMGRELGIGLLYQFLKALLQML